MEGELLVDGKPLGRLPITYTQSELYTRTFGAQILRVFVSNLPGMIYMSAQKFHGYIVYFGVRGNTVIIRVRQGAQTLELVPAHVLDSDLPAAFVSDYFHWMDTETRKIEFRPLNQRWQSHPENWHLHYQPHEKSILKNEHQKLVDIRSATCSAVMDVFAALETIENVHVTLSKESLLEVSFPRYDLRFFLNQDGEFQCYELCRIVDPDQSLGTLIGLKSRLILCSPLKLSRKHDRVVVIPDGKVSLSEKGTHIEASISTHGSSVRLFRYQIDRTLGRLQGESDMLATIYKAVLHAVTSHILSDPFTERTGTEEALSYLRQKSLSFTKPPDSKTSGLLKLIAGLTPRREYYPEHLQVMQKVRWQRALSMLV